MQKCAGIPAADRLNVFKVSDGVKLLALTFTNREECDVFLYKIKSEHGGGFSQKCATRQ